MSKRSYIQAIGFLTFFAIFSFLVGTVVSESFVSIGKQWKEFLDYNGTIGFTFHEDAKKLDRNAKNRYAI
ncbi:hypothetical protein Tsubulata_005026 [Turnera subulata]|uniref:Uncharacterized protein n=1 Tax=Turnera subulata TaxID=218843 RepID=A0A9Q0J3G2_9ROSI|nr:hypothetical protein Tsubulata_005026 [Turnera subulata]